jgi:ABC-type lipoprotein release transport system permease subunit
MTAVKRCPHCGQIKPASKFYRRQRTRLSSYCRACQVLGVGLGNLFMNAPLPFRVSLAAAGIWIALVILGAALATDAAATRASRITVREALTYL